MFAQTVGFNPAILHVVNPLPSVIWPLYLNYIVTVVFCQIIAAANCKSTKYGTIKPLLQKFNGSLSNKFDTCGICRGCLSAASSAGAASVSFVNKLPYSFYGRRFVYAAVKQTYKPVHSVVQYKKQQLKGSVINGMLCLPAPLRC